MIRAIIFDFGGVLMRTHTHSGRKAWEAKLGLDAGDLERLVHGSDLWIAAQRGELTSDAYWLAIADRLNLSIEDLPILREDYFQGDVFDAELVRLIDTLRDQGYRLGLLSNDSLALREKLVQLDLVRHFDAVVISAEIGAMKPEAAAYRAVAKALDVSTPECLFIDDNPVNIDGATAVGIEGLLYRSDMDVSAALATHLGEANKPTQCLIFDYGNVLDIPVDWDAYFAHREQVATRFGLDGKTLGALIHQSEAWAQVKVGAISWEEYLRQIFSPLGVTSHPEREALFHEVFDGREHVHPVMMDLLRELKPYYRLALLSNAYQTDVDAWMQSVGLTGMFEVAMSSAVVGLAKPDAAIYELILAQLNLAAGEALFIDDLARNTQVAEAAGLPCIVFESPQQLRNALAWRKILPIPSAVT